MKALVSVLIVAAGAHVAPAHAAEVTPLISKELAGTPSKEVVMITVEYPPGYDGSSFLRSSAVEAGQSRTTPKIPLEPSALGPTWECGRGDVR